MGLITNQGTPCLPYKEKSAAQVNRKETEMEESNEYIEYKECPACAEDIKLRANVCRYCGANIPKEEKAEGGKFISVRLKASGKIYTGDIYVTNLKCRVSDIVNDGRKFLSIVNTTEESKLNDVKIGYIALNKSLIEWICVVKEVPAEEDKPFSSHVL